MQTTGKLPTTVENLLSCFLYFQQMSNGRTAFSFQGDSYDHIKNTASDSKRKRADDSTVIHLGTDELKRNRKRKSLSVTQIAAGFRLLLLFFCCAKILHIANENKKREEQKKWIKINA